MGIAEEIARQQLEQAYMGANAYQGIAPSFGDACQPGRISLAMPVKYGAVEQMRQERNASR